MKAILHLKYGPFEVLEYGDAKKPEPGENDVLVNMYASAINAGNAFSVQGKPFIARLSSGIFKPKYLNPGSDVSGVVEEVGKKVTNFKPGDEVFGDNALGGFGTFAEYVSVPESELALKPKNITHEEAAAVPQAALVALQGLRDCGQIKPGQKVLIIGASGGNGTFAVQIAKAYSAHVTAVCSTRNIELVYDLGADQVIDYTKADFVDKGESYDLILVMGGYRSLSDYASVLRPGGKFVWAGGDLKGLFETMVKGPFWGRKNKTTFSSLSHHTDRQDLVFLSEMIETGKVAPVIDSIFPLEKTQEAFRHYESGHMRGKVVIKIR